MFSHLSLDERVVVTNVVGHCTKRTATLETWGNAYPRLQHPFLPVKSLLESRPAISLCSDTDVAAVADNTDSVVNLLLVHVQSMLAACPESADEYDERDRYIECDYHRVRNITRLLKLGPTLESLDSALLHLAIHNHDIRTQLRRILPFLAVYLQLAQEQLIAHSEWTKALFKLDFVLCSVTQTIAKDGFCKPPDTDEAGADGDTSEASGGMGLGAGEDSKNVSKDVEDESQVEGLKGDDDQGNDHQNNGNV